MKYWTASLPLSGSRGVGAVDRGVGEGSLRDDLGVSGIGLGAVGRCC